MSTTALVQMHPECMQSIIQSKGPHQSRLQRWNHEDHLLGEA